MRILIRMLVLLLAMGSSCAWAQYAQSPIQIRYSSEVEIEQIREIESDLALLRELRWVEPSGELQRLLIDAQNPSKLKVRPVEPTLNSQLQNFLAERIHFILDVRHPIEGSALLASPIKSTPFQSLPDTIFKISEKLSERTTVQAQAKLVANENSQTMLNAGSLIFISGKQKSEINTLVVDGIGELLVPTPRVGLLKLGPGFFKSQGIDSEVYQGFINKAFRLATLFHEARHDDGHGPSLGFMHVVCPLDHVYAGMPACDLPSNGPYRWGALILDTIEQNCSKCTPGMKDALEILRNDQLSRIQSKIPGHSISLTREQKEMCALDVFNAKDDPECGDPKNQIIEWDDQPEEIQ